MKLLLTFCEAHCSDGWVAEHHCGDSRVVQLGVLLALKQSVCKLSACSNGNYPDTQHNVREQLRITVNFLSKHFGACRRIKRFTLKPEKQVQSYTIVAVFHNVGAGWGFLAQLHFFPYSAWWREKLWRGQNSSNAYGIKNKFTVRPGKLHIFINDSAIPTDHFEMKGAGHFMSCLKL